MKKLLAISATVFSLMLVGAGCGAASQTATTSDASAPAAPTSAPAAGGTVASAFTQAGIVFTSKDKTAAAQSVLGADSALLRSFTEYKFEGSSLILLVGEVVDPNNAPMIGDALSVPMKAQAAAVGLEYSSVGGLNDAHWVAYVLEKAGDYDTKIKALGAISK